MVGLGTAFPLQHIGHGGGPPAWVAFTVTGFVLLACVGAGVWFAVCAARDWRTRDATDHDEGDTDDGGGGQDRKPPPPVGPSDGVPVWWPEFEREFAAYVTDRLTTAR